MKITLPFPVGGTVEVEFGVEAFVYIALVKPFDSLLLLFA